MTNLPPSVLWHCWLGHQTCKNRRPYNLYCVGADVKPCSIKALWSQAIGIGPNKVVLECVSLGCKHLIRKPGYR